MKNFIITTEIDGETAYLDKHGDYAAIKSDAVRFSESKAKKIAVGCPWVKVVKL